MGWAAGFASGSQLGRSIVDTYRQSQDYRDKELRKQEMADIASAQETKAYGPDDAAQIDAAAKAIGPDGKPYYTVGNDAAGNYTIAPNFQNETGDAPTAYAPTTMAAQGVSFLGKNYNAPLTEGQATGARQQAMAGVMERAGDVEGAMRYREQAKQGIRNEKTDAQQDIITKRTNAQFEQDDLYKKSKAEIDALNPQAGVERDFAGATAKYQGDLADYNKLLATPGTDARAVGAAPTAPTKGAVTPGQQVAYYAQVVANEHKFGKLNVTDMMNFDAMRKKLTEEGYIKTLKAAHDGMSLPELSKLFGEHGKEKFDPALVASDTTGKNADGMTTRTITFKDGRVLDTLKELESLDAADKLVARFYQGKTDKRADTAEVRADTAEVRAEKSLGIQQAQLGIQQTTAGLTNKLTQANIDEKNLAVADKKALGDLRGAYGVAVDSGDAKAIDTAAKKIHIFNRSGKGGEAASAFAQKVDLLMRANPGMSLAQVTDKAMAKAEQSADAYYAEILKPSNMGISIGTEKAEEFTRSAYPGWRAAATPGAGAAAAAGGTPVKGREASGKVGQIGAEQVISTGANKGKTAVFDGTGWILKP